MILLKNNTKNLLMIPERNKDKALKTIRNIYL